MNAMNLAITVLGAFYLLALVERFTKPELSDDEGLDQYYEQEYNNARDYYLASDNGYTGDF